VVKMQQKSDQIIEAVLNWALHQNEKTAKKAEGHTFDKTVLKFSLGEKDGKHES
jgi:hypothetical protein